jgi:hypothetical protein
MPVKLRENERQSSLQQGTSRHLVRTATLKDSDNFYSSRVQLMEVSDIRQIRIRSDEEDKESATEDRMVDGTQHTACSSMVVATKATLGHPV